MRRPPEARRLRLAELLDVLIGDWCISRFVSQGKIKFEVAFTGNSSEFKYYRGFLKREIENLFPFKGQLRLRKDNTVRLHFRSKRLAFFFLAIGLPLGKKRDALIPSIIGDKHMMISFIRGFYHAEGSIYPRYSKKYSYHARKYANYLVIQFRCKLKTLMRAIHKELAVLGIVTTRLIERRGVWTFRITDQLQIRKFMLIVRPRFKTRPKAE